MTIYWAGDMACLWAALQLVGGKQLTMSALILAYAGGYVLSRRSLPAGGAGVVAVALTLALVGMGKVRAGGDRGADLPLVQLLVADRAGASSDSDDQGPPAAVPAGGGAGVLMCAAAAAVSRAAVGLCGQDGRPGAPRSTRGRY